MERITLLGVSGSSGSWMSDVKMSRNETKKKNQSSLAVSNGEEVNTKMNTDFIDI